MANRITDEDINLNIIVNGDDAQKKLFDLEKETRKLTETNKALSIEKKRLERQGKQETEEYKHLTQEIKNNSRQITENKARMSELQKEIGLTSLTMKQLSDMAGVLRMKLRNAIPGTEAYENYRRELSEVTERINELNNSADDSSSSMEGLSDSFNKYAAFGASILAFLTGFVVSLQEIIDLNSKLSDAQSNVMKTTGMTKEEVDELTKSFGLLKTRTDRIELLGIAETGGRLGIAKDEINDFVIVMNKASVALGDSFEGGAEVVAEKLGRIKGLYEELKDLGVEHAFESVGSAMNDLGADGTASEANIAEFMTRVGALPTVLKPSAAEAAGLGAAFEESGLKAEVAGTNYGKVISIASRDFQKFAKFMGQPAAKIEQLLNTNPTEFFLQFARSLRTLDATELSKVLDYLKLNDNEVKMVLGAASQNTDLFRQKIAMAGESMKTATSLSNEFNIKNSNLAATLDKIKKTVTGWFASETYVNWLAVAIEKLAILIGATDDADDQSNKWKNTLIFLAKMIATVTAALITNTSWQKLVVLWTTRNTEATLLYNVAIKARAVTEAVSMIATQAYAAVTMLLTGNLRGAAQAVRVLIATMRSTPWGFILSAITAVVVAYQLFSDQASKLSAAQQVLSDIHLEATKNIAKEKAELDLLVKISKSENATKEQKEKALKRLNELIPDYIGKLSLENIKTAEGIGILKEYTNELYKNARAKAAQAKFDELAKQRLEVESKSGKDYTSKVANFLSKITFQSDDLEFKNRKEVEQYVLKTFANQLNTTKNKTTGATLIDKEMFKILVDKYVQVYGVGKKEAALAEIDAAMAALEKELEAKAISDLTKPEEKEVKPDLSFIEKEKKQKKYNDSYLQEEKRLMEELYQAWKKNEEDRIAQMKEGYEKELALENLKHTDILHQNAVENAAIIELEKKLQKDLLEAQKEGDKPKIKSINNMKILLTEKRKEVSQNLENEERLHTLRIAIIQEKAAKSEIEKLKDQYEQEKSVRETAFLEQMNSKVLSEDAKERLRKDFAKKELEYEKRHLLEIADLLTKAVSEQSVKGINFDLLSGDQKDKLAKDLELILNAIEKIREAQKKDRKNSTEIDLGISSPDILGFTQDQWDKFFQNINNGTIGLQTMQFAIGALQQLWGQYDSFMSASESNQLKSYERNSDRRKKALKSQLDNGIISQAQYKRSVEAIDRELDEQKAELEYKAAKRQKLTAALNVVTSTAQAIMSIWAQVPKFDFGASAGIMTGIVSALGAIQLATVLSTPLPAKGYEKGLYPEYIRREQDNKVFKASYGGKTRSGVVSSPTYFLTGENGPEMIIDNRAYQQMNPYLRDALINELRGVGGFENSYYENGILKSGSKTDTTNNPTNTGNSNDQLLNLVLQVVSESTAIMKDLRDSGILAVVSTKDARSMKELHDGLKKYRETKNKSKI